MRITLVRDDGKVKTLRTLKMELLLEQMKNGSQGAARLKDEGSLAVYSSGKFD